jgi:hypothetical protein
LAHIVWAGNVHSAKRSASGVCCRQPPALITSCLRRKRFPVAEAGQKHNPGHQATGIGNVDIIIPADPKVTGFGFFLDGNLHATP